jgi:hypothetical protein
MKSIAATFKFSNPSVRMVACCYGRVLPSIAHPLGSYYSITMIALTTNRLHCNGKAAPP